MVSTYSEAGVDIDASEKATEALIAQIKNVGRKGDGEAIKLDNGFAGLVKLGDGALAMCTDGVAANCCWLKKWILFTLLESTV